MKCVPILLTSCCTGLDKSVLQIRTKIVNCNTADSKPVKQEENGTVILPLFVFPVCTYNFVPYSLIYIELNKSAVNLI